MFYQQSILLRAARVVVVTASLVLVAGCASVDLSRVHEAYRAEFGTQLAGLDVAKRKGAIFPQTFAEIIGQAETVTDSNVTRLFERWQQDGFQVAELRFGKRLAEHSSVAMLDVRMLFSALVDADFLETEAHFNGDARQPPLSA